MYIYYIYTCIYVYIKCRCSLLRLPVSAHRLMIKCGRWTKRGPIPLDQRKCNMCQTLEDDFHFVLICSLFYKTKRKYIFVDIL